jgi:transcription initiation factor IIE alpha subunit
MLNKENNKKVAELLKRQLPDEEIARRTGLSIKEVRDIIDTMSKK